MSRHDADTGRLTPEILLRAYTAGIFPMAESRDDPQVFWVDPKERGILPLDGFHVPRRLKKTVRKNTFDITCNQVFGRVLDGCATPAPGRVNTWINDTIRQAILDLHTLGFAHSIEVWKGGQLVGGLYGVALRGAFFGESMFSWATDASKVGLVHLVARLRIGGFKLLDAQFVTEHLSRFGCVEIPARVYQQQLDQAIGYQARFPILVGREELARELDALFAESSDRAAQSNVICDDKA